LLTEGLYKGHTGRPADFCWAPGESENWTATSVSEDNIVMVWQPTMRVWAGDEVKIDEKELEGDAMEGIEEVNVVRGGKSTGGGKSATGSARSQSMEVSATTASVVDEEDT
jgi:histone-binding protein RBBP4